MTSLKEKYVQQSIDLIKKLEKKLEDENLTEGQFNVINAILERRRQALKEGRIY